MTLVESSAIMHVALQTLCDIFTTSNVYNDVVFSSFVINTANVSAS